MYEQRLDVADAWAEIKTRTCRPNEILCYQYAGSSDTWSTSINVGSISPLHFYSSVDMSTPHPSSPKSPSSPSHSPFAHLSPVLSSRSQRPPLNDGCDNFPCPLPSDALGLGRRLTGDPDVERQMALSIDGVGPPPEGGLEAWACVSGAFFILFCIFGFSESGVSFKSR